MSLCNIHMKSFLNYIKKESSTKICSWLLAISWTGAGKCMNVPKLFIYWFGTWHILFHIIGVPRISSFVPLFFFNYMFSLDDPSSSSPSRCQLTTPAVIEALHQKFSQATWCLCQTERGLIISSTYWCSVSSVPLPPQILEDPLLYSQGNYFVQVFISGLVCPKSILSDLWVTYLPYSHPFFTLMSEFPSPNQTWQSNLPT